MVDRWHFGMLNDSNRVQAFEKSLSAKIKQGFDRVLDIGTGTGIFTIIAYNCGAKWVVACEESEIMSTISAQVLRDNGLLATGRVELIRKSSLELELPMKPTLIVSEILDCGLFGEGVLQTLIHAKEKLLDDRGVIIPHAATLFVTGFQSKAVQDKNIVTNRSFEDSLYLGGRILVADSEMDYDSERVNCLPDFKVMTETRACFSVHFNDLNEMKNCVEGKKSQTVKLCCEKSGFLDGFVVWFKLHMDASASQNVIDTTPSCNSCWDQAIFKLNKRLLVEPNKELKLEVSCADGRLKLGHNYNLTVDALQIPEELISFINQPDYYNKLEFDIQSLIKRRNSKSGAGKLQQLENVLDFSPFPFVGMVYLKENRTSHLFCSISVRKFVEFVAKTNCVDKTKITFLDSPLEFLLHHKEGVKLNLIILNPVNYYGDIASDQIIYYDELKQCLDDQNFSAIIPAKLEMTGQLIKSEYLTNVSRITNEHLIRLRVGEHLNKFATDHILNLRYLKHEAINDEFHIAEIKLNDQFYEQLLDIKVDENQQVDGLIYSFKIYSDPELEPFYTKNSLHQACFLFSNTTTTGKTIKMHLLQNYGLLSCRLLN